MDIDFSGLDEFAKKVKKESETKDVPIIEVITDSFIVSNSKFDSTQDFFDKSGFDFSDIESIPENELDLFVNESTNFDSWQDLLSTAGQEYFIRKLGL